VTGATERLAVAQLHSRIQSTFRDLQRASERKYAFLSRGGEAADDGELERNRRLFQLYADMNSKIAALFAMRDAGQSEVAVRVFYSAIDSGLDDAFEQMISTAVGDSIAAAAAADRAAEKVATNTRRIFAAFAAFAAIAIMIAGYRLYRSIDRPIRKLTAGAVAIGRGDLGHRVGPLGGDELGLLARRFDEMAGQIGQQRAMLEKARSNLEAEVVARTAELELANDWLERQDRSRARFLADVSHELRTPLTVVRGEAEVTLRDAGADLAAHKQALRQIIGQAQEMSRLVEDLLALARSESEDLHFERELIDLSEVAAEAAREASILGGARRLAIHAALADVLPVEGDRQRLKQVVMILLDNAVKYSPEGEAVDLDVAGNGERVSLSVTNRAPRLGEDDLPHVFERFYRGGPDAGEAEPGSGLGLSIARWLVERQGGSIAFERDVDRVRIIVGFPVAPVDAEALDEAKEPPLAAE
jgi:signal transduction histidine kinase